MTSRDVIDLCGDDDDDDDDVQIITSHKSPNSSRHHNDSWLDDIEATAKQRLVGQGSSHRVVVFVDDPDEEPKGNKNRCDLNLYFLSCFKITICC